MIMRLIFFNLLAIDQIETLNAIDWQNIRYDIRGWSQRNKSRLPGNVIMLLKNSENPLLSLLIKGLDIKFQNTKITSKLIMAGFMVKPLKLF